MKRHFRMLMGIVLTVIITVTSIVPVSAANITTTATGYTSASDVKYQYHEGKYISNWGARGEVATFLSPNAEKFYTGSYTYDVLSDKQGGTSQSSAPSSALYKALQSMMKAEHSHQTSYGETRYQYRYTDCVSNNTSNISSFYSGKVLSGTWDSGSTWNREHTWPNSKGLGGNDENDIMMLRPTWVQENSSRGNTAYGEGGSYYDPGESVRGDCARIVLYVYVRWGNTSKMWGTGGVMENMDVLLKWMEEDPVDTWEMGRNDAVESITGTRNVFVDYPEYAWLLFGEEIPEDMTTPSGIAKSGDDGNNDSGNGGNTGNDNPSNPACKHTNTRLGHEKAATCTKEGYTGDLECEDCGAVVKAGTKIPATGHKNTEVKGAIEATCSKEGYTGDTYCKECGTKLQSGTTIAAGAHNTELQGVKEPTCTEDGYSGDLVCKDCGTKVQEGQIVTAPGHHTFGDWVVVKEATATTYGSKERSCSVCEHKETETIPATGEVPGSETESEEPNSTETENKPGENGTQDTQTGKPGDNSDGDKDSVDPGVIAVAVAIPCVCAVGGISAVVIKRKISK
ncbi:MAG: hypothetical protein E7283_06005 [Lachnospiraceae bacterium]|nr:hypothetical protein [Lachnospiraceae bacterium]